MRLNKYEPGTYEYELFEILAEIGQYGSFEQMPKSKASPIASKIRKMHGRHPTISISEFYSGNGTVLGVLFDCGDEDYSDDSVPWPLDDWWLSEHKYWGSDSPNTIFIVY